MKQIKKKKKGEINRKYSKFSLALVPWAPTLNSFPGGKKNLSQEQLFWSVPGFHRASLSSTPTGQHTWNLCRETFLEVSLHLYCQCPCRNLFTEIKETPFWVHPSLAPHSNYSCLNPAFLENQVVFLLCGLLNFLLPQALKCRFSL